MFRDRKKELGRIEQALLEEEEYFRDPDEAEVLDEISRTFEEEQQPAPEPVMAPRKKRRKENLKPLILSALLMTIAILGLLIFWALRIQL